MFYPAAASEHTLSDRRSLGLLVKERKFAGGSSQISECMAKELGDRVKLQSPVYRIDQTGEMVVVETVNKETYTVSGTKSRDSGSQGIDINRIVSEDGTSCGAEYDDL